MLTSLVEELIRRDLMLSAMRTVDTRRYIVSSWNRTQPESIDENAVALFLCDDNQGSLTDEQRAFARERREEMSACYERVVFRILLWAEMSRLGIVSGWTSTAGCFCRWTVPFGKGRIAPLNGLCGAVCPPLGWGKVPVPSGFPGGFGPIPGSASRAK